MQSSWHEGIPMKTLVTACSTLLLLVLAPSCGQADPVDDYVQEQMRASHTPGISVGVVRDGKVLLAKGYGLANVEAGSPAAADTVYEILSVSKQFTAAAVLMLVEAGKLSLDDPVSKYLSSTPASWK